MSEVEKTREAFTAIIDAEPKEVAALESFIRAVVKEELAKEKEPTLEAPPCTHKRYFLSYGATEGECADCGARIMNPLLKD